MTFEQLQNAWQNEQNTSRFKVDSELLLKEVKRNKKNFEDIIFWRDFRELIAAAIGAAFCFYFGMFAWPMYLVGASAVIVGTFSVVDSIKQRRRSPHCQDTLGDCASAALAQVEHQIWLLRKIFWWYLLPPAGPIVFFYLWMIFRFEIRGRDLFVPVALLTGTLLFFCYVYWLNQYAVKKELLPRRRELRELLAALKQSES